MKIIYGYVYTENAGFVQKDIQIQDNLIVSCGGMEEVSGTEEVLDAKDCYVLPGLTDIHFHGCVGYDFCDGTIEGLKAMASYQASVGVTSIIPATMTLPEEELVTVCKTAAVFAKEQQDTVSAITSNEEMQNCEMATLCGINMEGPFVSEKKSGAQNAGYLKEPDQKLFDRLQRACGGLIKMVDLAPELPGAMEFIRRNAQKVILSLAHTAADYDTAKEAFGAGACHVTHLFNAMTPFGHRQPGVIGAAVDEGAYAELICDGIHVHPSMIRSALKLFGEDRIIFISDSMMATGLSDGDYSLGKQSVKVKGRVAYLQDGTIAGSVSNLMECMRRAVLEMNIPLETAVKCAAVNPVKHMGLYDKYGSIEPGKIANLVLLDKESMEVKLVILNGRCLK